MPNTLTSIVRFNIKYRLKISGSVRCRYSTMQKTTLTMHQVKQITRFSIVKKTRHKIRVFLTYFMNSIWIMLKQQMLKSDCCNPFYLNSHFFKCISFKWSVLVGKLVWTLAWVRLSPQIPIHILPLKMFKIIVPKQHHYSSSIKFCIDVAFSPILNASSTLPNQMPLKLFQTNTNGNIA